MIRPWYLKTITVLLGVALTLGVTALPVMARQIPVNDAGFYMGASPGGKPHRSDTPLTNGSADQARNTANAPTFQAECPPTIRCVVVPAVYAANDGNIEDYGNYDITNRPSDMKINSIIIHDTEGDLQSVLDHFKNPKAYVSAQYVVAPDGTVYQMVQNKNVAWHAGNWWYNMHAIGIEHVAHAALGGTEFTPAMYHASAQLVKYLTSKYNIPRDTAHIIGSDMVPAPNGARVPQMHVDPGPFWNWQNYLAMIGAQIRPSGNFDSRLVMIAPVWPLSKQPATGCSGGTNNGCVPAGLQPTNFVYLRTEPRTDAPFFTDLILGQGSTEISNNAARLFYGQTFAVADRRLDRGGIWYKVWVNGLAGWFYSPWHAPTAFPASGQYITPKMGRNSIPVYGRPSPEASAYPAGLLDTPPASFWIPAMAPTAPLPYSIPAGQKYRIINQNVVNDHFYAWSSTADRERFPYDHTVFTGATRYIQIQYGNRAMFVKAADVDIH